MGIRIKKELAALHVITFPYCSNKKLGGGGPGNKTSNSLCILVVQQTQNHILDDYIHTYNTTLQMHTIRLFISSQQQ